VLFHKTWFLACRGCCMYTSPFIRIVKASHSWAEILCKY
jgi:hypothetical protein